jgi:hypothetical protein
MTWEEITKRIQNEDEDGKVTWEHVKEMVKRENENEEKRSQEIRIYDAEISKKLQGKLRFVTNDSIRFTRDEYDKLKTAFCKGRGWSQDYPHTVNVRSITLTGNYKWMPATSVEFQIETDEQETDQRIEAPNDDTKLDKEKENF